eukprot:scaffold118633_cov57-Phaeocystis_antarctica.AAC.3
MKNTTFRNTFSPAHPSLASLCALSIRNNSRLQHAQQSIQPYARTSPRCPCPVTGSCGAVRANTHTPHPLPLQVELARRHEGAHDVVRHVAARSLVQLHHGRDDVDELL